MDTHPISRWHRLDTLFADALERPADERAAFLRTACDGDETLYAEVLALLDQDTQAEALLGESATDYAAPLLPGLASALASPTAEAGLKMGTRLGPYRILGELGRGGMGTVYRAERADGTFTKQVALKLVKRGMDTDEVLRRFGYERQILAGLDHPGIARLLDAGAAPDGRPYLVMELAEGIPITTYAETRGLSVDARLDLFIQVAEAVRYAHRRLVVHRDLKPSNILVTDEESGQPQVKLLDFGIAKLLTADGTLQTQVSRPMTPAYAAPEQRAGEAITTATDVYALGVIGYELLTGTRPETPAVAPSVVATHRQVRDDLDTLIVTALHPDPDRRYASAEALLDDLDRFREGLPLQARPDTVGYRVRKVVGRHRWGVGVAALGALALMLFALTLAVQQRRTARALEDAEATAAFLESLFAAADPFAAERLDTLRVRELLAVGTERVRAELADQPLVRARLLQVLGETYLRTRHPADAEPLLREAVEALASAPPARRAGALVALAAVRRERSDFAEAERLAREALALVADASEPDGRAEAETELALVLRSTDRQDEALPLNRAALDRLQAAHGEDHYATLDAEADLAGLLFELGRLAEAEARYRSILERLRRLDGGTHARHHAVLDRLSFLLRVSGRPTEALRLSAESVALAREAVPGSSRLAQSLTGHAGVLVQLGQAEEAERVLTEALALPARRPADRAVALGTLATARQRRGALAEAEAAQREAWTILREALSDDHAITAHSALKLGVLLRAQERFAEAERLLLQAHRVLADDADGHDPRGQQAAAELVALYEAWGRPEEAAPYRAAIESNADD